MAFLAQSKQHQPPRQHRSRGRLDPDRNTEGRPPGLPLVSSVLLAFGIYVTIFANSESFGVYAQVLAVSAIVLSASTAFIFGSSARVVRPALGWYGLSLLGMTISSVVSACMTEEDYALKYTPVFFVMTTAFMILSRQISVRQLESLMRTVFACAVITLIAADAHTISQSLDVSNMLHWSLRYRPFDTHPNLAGLTYGFGLVLCVNGAISRKGIGRYISLGCAAGCTLILLATSSRASFLASTASLFLCHLMKFRYLSTKRKMLVLCLIAVALMPTLLVSDRIAAFLWKVFEMDSSTRGVSSGGTGRTALWAEGLEYVFDRPLIAMFGGGLRFSDSLTFSTEDSYISILIDSGAFVWTIYFASIAACIVSASRRFAKTGAPEVFVLINLILFVLIESIFNRYLLAIGNPPGILFTLICLLVSGNSRAERRAGGEERLVLVDNRVRRLAATAAVDTSHLWK